MNDYENIVLSNLDSYLDNYESVFRWSHRSLDLNTERYIKNIAFFGCSLTYGLGVSNEYTYPFQVQRLSDNKWNCLNFGVPAGSIDLACILYQKVVKEVDIDCVVIQWPNFYRRMYFEEGKYIGYHPTLDHNVSKSFGKVSDLQYCIVRNIPNLQIINSFKKVYNLLPKIGHKRKDLFKKYGIDNILDFHWYYDMDKKYILENDNHPNELWYEQYAKYLYKELINVI